MTKLKASAAMELMVKVQRATNKQRQQIYSGSTGGTATDNLTKATRRTGLFIHRVIREVETAGESEIQVQTITGGK